MVQSQVLSGLVAKRTELAGQVEKLQREMREVVLAIDHIDATIRVFDPAADLAEIATRLPPRHMAFRGEITRLILTALRKSEKPLSVSEITSHVAVGRGLSGEDKPFMRTLSRRVGACLRILRKKELVRVVRAIGHVGLWEIAR